MPTWIPLLLMVRMHKFNHTLRGCWTVSFPPALQTRAKLQRDFDPEQKPGWVWCDHRKALDINQQQQHMIEHIRMKRNKLFIGVVALAAAHCGKFKLATTKIGNILWSFQKIFNSQFVPTPDEHSSRCGNKQKPCCSVSLSPVVHWLPAAISFTHKHGFRTQGPYIPS